MCIHTNIYKRVYNIVSYYIKYIYESKYARVVNACILMFAYLHNFLHEFGLHPSSGRWTLPLVEHDTERHAIEVEIEVDKSSRL